VLGENDFYIICKILPLADVYVKEIKSEQPHWPHPRTEQRVTQPKDKFTETYDNMKAKIQTSVRVD
jgi:hypothetical protein